MLVAVESVVRVANPVAVGVDLPGQDPPEHTRRVGRVRLHSLVGAAKLEHHAGLVLHAYTARLAEHPIAPYVPFEHQSTSDPWMAFRLLCYRVRIWRRWRDDHPQAKRLPAILPVVLSHAEGGWKAAMSMHELFDLPDDLGELLGRYLPQSRYILDDLSDRSDDELMARALGAMGLLALLLLRHGRDKHDFLLRLKEWASLLRAVWQAEDGREAVRERVVSCANVATLDRWIARAATVDGIDEVFGQ